MIDEIFILQNILSSINDCIDDMVVTFTACIAINLGSWAGKICVQQNFRLYGHYGAILAACCLWSFDIFFIQTQFLSNGL